MQRLLQRNLHRVATGYGTSQRFPQELRTRSLYSLSTSITSTSHPIVPAITVATQSNYHSSLLALIPFIAFSCNTERAKAEYPAPSSPSFTVDDFTKARPTVRKEADTGVIFPVELSTHEQLSGIAARFMRGLVKVYAVGVYIDSDLAKERLKSWKGYSAQELETAEPVWETLCQRSSLHRVVRLVVVRDVAGKHMQQGFERALLSRAVKKAKEGYGKPSESKALVKEFCGMFTKVGTMKIGSDIRISVDADAVRLVVDGRDLGVVHSDTLAWAVMDMFVGGNSVVKGLRKDVAHGLENVLK